MGARREFSRVFKLEAVRLLKDRWDWLVNLLYEALGISRIGFYVWLVRPPSRRS
jgi:hypothetical protein